MYQSLSFETDDTHWINVSSHSYIIHFDLAQAAEYS